MSPNDKPYQKRYYSIGEVADMFDVSKSLIRFWEAEFDGLRPHKNNNGERRFTPETIEQFRNIYHLVKERGFTLEGAKLEMQRAREERKIRQEKIQQLKELRAFLHALRDSL